MSKTPVYTIHATSTGGRDGKAVAPASDLEIALAVPAEMGGIGNVDVTTELL